MHDIIRLLRPYQWYKNLVIFVALFFAKDLFMLHELYLTIAGFFALCAVSSAGYILNDLVDRRDDRLHPEKRQRPLAKKTVGVGFATVLALLLCMGGLLLAFLLSRPFFYTVLTLFLVTLAYTLFLKNHIFVDILLIGINFVIRTLSGVVLIGVEISPWLLVCVFFLALFLVSVKRKSDLLLPRSKLPKSLQHYSVQQIDGLVLMSVTVLLTCYCLYSFFRQEMIWLVTVPVALYGILRYLYITQQDPSVGRQPEKAFKDVGMITAMLVWSLMAGVMLYV